MSFTITSEGRLMLTIECEISLLEFNPKYPKNPKKFGERLRKKRMDLGLTMKDIARKVGVTEATVSNWERRNIKPYRKTREKIRELFDLEEEIPV
ncbi:MAG: helix-turn-helix transcriptional regulator [Candidatus Omnitrophota bacterium]